MQKRNMKNCKRKTDENQGRKCEIKATDRKYGKWAKKPHGKNNRRSTTKFTDLDEFMSVDESTIIKRTRNVLSYFSSSETAQSKTKKGNAVEKTSSEGELSNLTLDDFRITPVEFEKLPE
jgi:hypothetical protein